MLSLITGSLLWQSFSGLSFAKVGVNLVHDVTAFIDWLSRDFWRVTTLVLAIWLGVQHFSLVSARHEAAKWEKQFQAEKAQLDKLSAQSKAQQKVVTQTVNHYFTVTKPEVEKEVQRIESTPAVPGCKTPPAILGADL